MDVNTKTSQNPKKMDMRIKIADGAAVDIKTFGMELVKSPERFGFKIKESNIIRTDFPEEDGIDVYIPQTPKRESFEYKITLAFVAEDNEKIADKVSSFIESLRGKVITIYNDYKGVQLEGYLVNYSDGEFYKGSKVATFELTFLIADPNKVVFIK